MMETWKSWLSVRHQDGRRPSGVGYNVSRLHLLDVKHYYSLCGREVGFGVSEKRDRPKCKVCLKKAKGVRDGSTSTET